jgi:hypothetical protein
LTIGDAAFARCENLSSVAFESGSPPPGIDRDAFQYCSNLDMAFLRKRTD